MSLIIHFHKQPFKLLKNSHFRSLFARFFSSSSNHSLIEAESLYTALLDKSTSKIHLNQIHTRLYTHGLQNNGFIITKFINTSSNIEEIDYARKVFDEFPDRYVFLWNAIIRGYSIHNMLDKVIEMYSQMQHSHVSPDAFTFPHVVKACGGLRAVGYGRAVHAQIYRLGLESDTFLQNGLLSFYLKCEENHCARIVFHRLSDKNVVSWTSIISGFAQGGRPIEALRIFKNMRKSSVKPDWIELVSVLKAYSDVEDLSQGKCVHGLVVKIGHEFEVDLRIALISLYMKCGHVMAAKTLFDQMKTEDVILWNAMLSGYSKNGLANEALDIFTEMGSRNIMPDAITIQSSVLACAHLGSLVQAKKMDDYIQNSKFKNDILVRTSLIDMYAKCGSLELAREVFNSSIEKDVVLWSSMVMGYALHGQGREAIDLFENMTNSGFRPNDVTFLGLITACSHSGLISAGWGFFLQMKKDYGLNPDQKHYASIVDLLGRAGHLQKAFQVITTMAIEPSVSVWGALLSACKIHRHVALGEYAANELFKIDPFNTGHYVQLSNLYATSRIWEGVEKVRNLMKSKGLTKDLGHSIIEVNGNMEAFRMGDKWHPRTVEIYEKLEWLEARLMEAGFVVDVESAMHDLDEEEKGWALCGHSERLAIAYGLISTHDGSEIRISKNLRGCVNCHLATKLISKFVGRDIVVRDVKRFHHFKDGECSCGDYW